MKREDVFKLSKDWVHQRLVPVYLEMIKGNKEYRRMAKHCGHFDHVVALLEVLPSVDNDEDRMKLADSFYDHVNALSCD